MKFSSENIHPENTWQIGTGDDTRGYSDLFFNLGVALVGPGDPGREGDAATAEYYKEEGGTNWGAKLAKVKVGEWLIARKGKRAILGVGQVTHGYNYSSLFEDVQGWDLQHFVRVQWYRPVSVDKTIWLDEYILGHGTLLACNKQEVYDALYSNEFELYPPSINIETLRESGILSLSEINEILISSGIRIQDADYITDTLNKVIRLTKWYLENDDSASERELVAFLIVPFLIALGWSEQKIKIEYNNIDVAIFNHPFTGDYTTSPEIIVEAKKFKNGLAFTSNQIATYGKYYPSCRRFIISNGYKYKYFEKVGDVLECLGSIDLRTLKLVDVLSQQSKNALETLIAMSNY